MSTVTGTVVLAGDSITEWGRGEDPLGSGYVRLLAEGPLAGAHVINAGVGGDRAADLERRWTADVLAERPDVLGLYVGVNDTWRRFDQGEETPVEQFTATCRRLLSSVSVPTVVVEPFVVPVDEGQREWAADLGPKQAALRALADEVGAAFVPLAGLMADLAARIGPQSVAADGVHPTPAGHELIARAWWDAYVSRFGA